MNMWPKSPAEKAGKESLQLARDGYGRELTDWEKERDARNIRMQVQSARDKMFSVGNWKIPSWAENVKFRGEDKLADRVQDNINKQYEAIPGLENVWNQSSGSGSGDADRIKLLTDGLQQLRAGQIDVGELGKMTGLSTAGGLGTSLGAEIGGALGQEPLARGLTRGYAHGMMPRGMPPEEMPPMGEMSLEPVDVSDGAMLPERAPVDTFEARLDGGEIVIPSDVGEQLPWLPEFIAELIAQYHNPEETESRRAEFGEGDSGMAPGFAHGLYGRGSFDIDYSGDELFNRQRYGVRGPGSEAGNARAAADRAARLAAQEKAKQQAARNAARLASAGKLARGLGTAGAAYLTASAAYDLGRGISGLVDKTPPGKWLTRKIEGMAQGNPTKVVPPSEATQARGQETLESLGFRSMADFNRAANRGELVYDTKGGWQNPERAAAAALLAPEEVLSNAFMRAESGPAADMFAAQMGARNPAPATAESTRTGAATLSLAPSLAKESFMREPDGSFSPTPWAVEKARADARATEPSLEERERAYRRNLAGYAAQANLDVIRHLKGMGPDTGFSGQAIPRVRGNEVLARLPGNDVLALYGSPAQQEMYTPQEQMERSEAALGREATAAEAAARRQDELEGARMDAAAKERIAQIKAENALAQAQAKAALEGQPEVTLTQRDQLGQELAQVKGPMSAVPLMQQGLTSLAPGLGAAPAYPKNLQETLKNLARLPTAEAQELQLITALNEMKSVLPPAEYQRILDALATDPLTAKFFTE